MSPGGRRSEPSTVRSSRCRLDVFLQKEEQGDRVGQPIREAHIVVLLLLDLASHGVDDAVEQLCAVGLEGLPLKAASENDQGSNWSTIVISQINCKSMASLGPWTLTIVAV